MHIRKRGLGKKESKGEGKGERGRWEEGVKKRGTIRKWREGGRKGGRDGYKGNSWFCFFCFVKH